MTDAVLAANLALPARFFLYRAVVGKAFFALHFDLARSLLWASGPLLAARDPYVARVRVWPAAAPDDWCALRTGHLLSLTRLHPPMALPGATLGLPHPL